MEFDGALDIKAREIEDLKKSPEELTRQAAMRWADGQIDPLLPQAPFFLHIVGGIGRGKTTIILNMLREYQKYNTFCRVIYLSPSGKNDAKLRMFLTADNASFEYTEENLSKLIKEIEEENARLKGSKDNAVANTPIPAAGAQGLSPQEIKRRIQAKIPPTLGGGKSAALSGLAAPKTAYKTKEDLAREARKKVSCRTLIIADDATGSILTKRNTFLTEFAVSIRHQDVSMIVCTHSDTSLSAQLRNIVTGQILFEPGSGRELKTLVEDVGGVSQDTLINILSHVQRVPHGFVFIDKKRPFQDRFILNFQNVIDPDAFDKDKKDKATVEGRSLQLFRSGGFLPTPSQATSAEAKFAQKAYALQQEATLLNRGLTPAEKILAEQNATAKREQQVRNSASTSTVKRAQNADIARAGRRQVAEDAVRVTGAIRSAAFKRGATARLTSLSAVGGALDEKFHRGVSRNVAIATGGRRGIGGRGRRSSAALGPLAQQLEENIRLEQDLKRQRDQLSKDEEARKAEAEMTQFAPGTVGPFLPDETLINQHARDNPPPLPSAQLARPTPGLFPLRGQPSSILTDQVADSAKTFQERAAARRAEAQQAAGAFAYGQFMSQLRQQLPPKTEDRKRNDGNQVVWENQPETQQSAADGAAVTDMNLVDNEANDDPGPQEGQVKQDLSKLPPLPPTPTEMEIVPPAPTPDSGSSNVLAKPNRDSTDGPAFGGSTAPVETILSPAGTGSIPKEQYKKLTVDVPVNEGGDAQPVGSKEPFKKLTVDVPVNEGEFARPVDTRKKKARKRELDPTPVQDEREADRLKKRSSTQTGATNQPEPVPVPVQTFADTRKKATRRELDPTPVQDEREADRLKKRGPIQTGTLNQETVSEILSTNTQTDGPAVDAAPVTTGDGAKKGLGAKAPTKKKRRKTRNKQSQQAFEALADQIDAQQ